MEEDGERKTGRVAGLPSGHFYANSDIQDLKSSKEVANSNEFPSLKLF